MSESNLTPEKMFEKLARAGSTGLDLSPGDPVCRWAAARIADLERELNRVTRGDVSNIITTLGDALTHIATQERALTQAQEALKFYANDESDEEFKALIDRYESAGSSECWQKMQDSSAQTVNAMIDREVANRGYRNWAHAYHDLVTP